MFKWTSRSRKWRGVLVFSVAVLAVSLTTGPGLADEWVLEENPVLSPARDICGSISLGGGSGGGGDIDGAPTSFSLVPAYVTPVKNQGACGSCWAFASYGSMESSALVEGMGTYDLSENNLKNYHGFDFGPCVGGNVYMSWAYLSRLDGPVSEACDPYHDWDDRPSPGGPRQLFLKDSPVADTSVEIKDLVMANGALHTSMYWDDPYYNAGEYTYRYTGGTSTNHAVTIVGWDDNKTVSGATNPGAWQIKNSWGAGFGDSGYFWISYEDTAGCNYGASLQAGAAGMVEDVYYHDEFGNVGALNCPYAYNAFTTTQEEILKSVGFYTEVDGAFYDLRIYDTVSGGVPSGLLAQVTGTIDLWGFHVVDLPFLVELGANDDFIVYLYLVGGAYPQAFDFAVADYSSASVASPGESFYSFGGAWTDLSTFDSTANFAIKAFTIPEPATMALLALGGLAALRRRRK